MKLLFWKGRMSKDQFRERFVEAIRQRFPHARTRKGGELELIVDGLSESMTYELWLGRAYQEFEQNPKNIEDIFQRWLDSFAPPEEPVKLEDRLASLVPMIKDRAWLKGQQEFSTSHDTQLDLWIEDYNAELLIAYAEFRSGIHFVSNKSADSFGLPREDLRQIALRNLRERTRGRTVTGDDGLFLIGAGGNLEASLLLNDEVWRDARLQVRGDFIVGVPDRDSFVVGGDSDPGLVFEAAAMVCRLHRSERYGVSDKLFQRKNSRFEPVDDAQRDDSHPIPALDVIDVYVKRTGGGAKLVLVVATPLQADARSIYRLFRKLDIYLSHVVSEAFEQECGVPTPENTTIDVCLHPGSAPGISELLGSLDSWVRQRSAALLVRSLEVNE